MVMISQKVLSRLSVLALAITLLFSLPGTSLAHCDSMDGPVVQAAIKALDTGDVNLVLVWVSEKDENQIREAFQKTEKVRKLNAQARELADHYFFETLVRIHRAGEGAPYTGLKPAGLVLEKGIDAAEHAITEGKIESIHKELSPVLHQNLEKRFHHLMEKKNYSPSDVSTGREYVAAYVEFIHYVEGLFLAAEPVHAGHGSEQEVKAQPQPVHQH